MYNTIKNYRLTNNDGWVHVGRQSRPAKTSYMKPIQQSNYTEYKPQYNIQKDDTNYKKTLCKNINNIGKCIYSNKCLFAHNLEEQHVDHIRLVAYNMIKKNDDLSHIDLSKNKHLYNQLNTLTKLCQHCEEKTCTGGYNCKHGACDKIYVICQTDLNKGTCEGKCGKIHLTDKKLTPYGVSILQYTKPKMTIPVETIINDDFFKSIERSGSKNNNESDKDADKDVDKDADGESLYSNESDKTENIFDIFPLSKDTVTSDTDSLDDLNYDDLHSREEKLKKSIFKIDVMCI